MRTREQTCEACGRSFGCGAEAEGCWCERITLDAMTSARLRSDYARCLCPRCLEAAAPPASPAPSA
jgi:hypothetical protein